MWCAKCQSEVAVEARPNSQRLHCATCGTEISPRPNRSGPVRSGGQGGAGPQTPAEGNPGTTPPPKNPHELLARWAGNQMFDPYGPIISPEGKIEPPPEPRPQPPKPAAKPAAKSAEKPTAEHDQSAKIRIDPAFTEGWSEIPAPHTPSSTHGHGHGQTPPLKLTEQELPRGQRAHAPSRLQGPHFDPARLRQPVNQTNWIAWFGQTLAYVGAGTLTVGAGMVLIGYMGGPTHYAPTGWFTTTVGQMLLFLGVVTLVSAGMEQTTFEVAKRIDTLGDQLERMEFHAHAKSVASEAEVEAELRAEIAQLRQQLSEHRRGG